jgi:predicted helicase
MSTAMSRLLIHQYYCEVDKLIQYGGSRNESNITGAFERLLNEYCKTRDFLLIPKLDYPTKSGKTVYPDGTVKDALRLAWGYWESKDEYDDLDKEIDFKLNSKGYPNDNILFEDSRTAVLIQRGEEKLRVPVRDAEALDRILNEFINYVRPEVKDFREAIEAFKTDLPTILIALRDLLDRQSASNPAFISARDKFFDICKNSINPQITLEDVREMIIQHILTEDIFINIFNESQFHRENNIARELQGVIETFFTGSIKRNTLSTIERYYAVIRRTAASIYNHQEKQRFLKAVYENFYKAYNPKAADRLGIVYTPNEIVRFMIESVDYLVHKHFGKVLADSGVEILDPATGTGTFITELVEYLPKDKLPYKYQNEIHCNEVAILPYYIANLNIEFAYKQKMGEYLEFDNICFVDTLDSMSYAEKQMDLFSMSVENTERIKRQKEKRISVIIGNPPYNAKQENFSHNNANRKYKSIDDRIKETYIKQGTAQNQNVLYDMYTRFICWATDRLDENGVLAFITNSSFIDAITFDGFRKVISQEFSEIYILDLGGNIRKNPKLSGTTHNVFGIQTGVAISLMVKRENQNLPCKIYYLRRPEDELISDKLIFLGQSKLNQLSFQHIQPDKKNNWINQSYNDFDGLLTLASKEVKNRNSEEAIFKLFSLGVKTQRDEWTYDYSKPSLVSKIDFLLDVYNRAVKNNSQEQQSNDVIKWTRALTNHFTQKRVIDFSKNKIIKAVYRPFVSKYLYFDKHLNEMPYQMPSIFRNQQENLAIFFSDIAFRSPFSVLVVNTVAELHLCSSSDAFQCLPLYRYDKEGKRIENITDWGLNQFQSHYQNSEITKENIFHYTYAVLHNPAYRQKYELNLKREFPRIPFYDNFPRWVNWGKELMNLHIDYETIEPYPLTRVDIPLEKGTPKPKLKANQTDGTILLDDITTLGNIPPSAWEYQLGNRCALEWILDQYKEKKPKDKTIAEKFHTYRFADYKETVIDLLARVCTVSVETIKIIEAMKAESSVD